MCRYIYLNIYIYMYMDRYIHIYIYRYLYALVYVYLFCDIDIFRLIHFELLNHYTEICILIHINNLVVGRLTTFFKVRY